MNKEIFTLNGPQLSKNIDSGPEPTIKEIIQFYYNQHGLDESEYSKKYIDSWLTLHSKSKNPTM